MVTLVANIIHDGTPQEILAQKKQIKSVQKNFSFAFHELFKYFQYVLSDKECAEFFRLRLIEKYIHSSKWYEYLYKEVDALYQAVQEQKQDVNDAIEALKKQIDNPEVSKQLKRDASRKLSKKISDLDNKTVFGGRKLLSDLSKQFQKSIDPTLTQKQRDENFVMYQKNLDKFHEKRLLNAIFYGEASRGGNRFFDLSALSEGEVLFKYESTDIRFKLKFRPRSRRDKEWLKLVQKMTDNDKLPVTINFDTKHINITFAEDLVYETQYNYKKELKKRGLDPKMVEYTPEFGKEIHDDFNKELCQRNNKIQTRFGSMDMNSNGLSLVIFDKKVGTDYSHKIPVEDILYKEFFEFGLLNDLDTDTKTNKKQYEQSIVIKKMFLVMEHYRVFNFVMEKIDIDAKDYGNRVSNKKINNDWNRTYIKQLVTRKSNTEGVNLIPIEPFYSSFAGNLIYNEYDPIAAAMEIGRRGINKYINGSEILPSLNDDVLDGFRRQLLEKMDKNKLGSKKFAKLERKLNQAKSWKALYAVAKEAGTSVRRVRDNFPHLDYWLANNKRSRVRRLTFIPSRPPTREELLYNLVLYDWRELENGELECFSIL